MKALGILGIWAVLHAEHVEKRIRPVNYRKQVSQDCISQLTEDFTKIDGLAQKAADAVTSDQLDAANLRQFPTWRQTCFRLGLLAKSAETLQRVYANSPQNQISFSGVKSEGEKLYTLCDGKTQPTAAQFETTIAGLRAELKRVATGIEKAN